MINKLAAVFFCSMVLGNAVLAQDRCATDIILQHTMQKDPGLQARYLQYQQDMDKQVKAYEMQMGNAAQKTTSKYAVALVFHVVVNQRQLDSMGGTQGVYNRVVSQVEVLNRDYNALNPDSVDILPGFKPLFGNANIAFGVAHTKDGQATTGVEIKIASPTFTGFDVTDNNIKSSAGGGLDPWDNTKYLNIWITNITNSGSVSGEILGYAYSPAYAKNVFQNPQLTGVVVDLFAFGKRKTGVQNFIGQADQGRTTVHELGHFFTLNHIWGNTGVGMGTCTDDDGVSDTPIQQDANQSICPAGIKANCPGSASNPNGEMYMNYMDYVNDACMHMFSKGQVVRMQSEFAPTGGSYQLQFNGNLFNYPTGINTLATANSFDIVPNPTTGIFSISFANSTDALKGITIVNMVGQTVKTVNNATGQSVNVDMSAMQKGIYMVQCHFNEGTVTRKIVLQ